MNNDIPTIVGRVIGIMIVVGLMLLYGGVLPSIGRL